MFRNELIKKLSSIFGLRKTTFDAPSMDQVGSFEQETLFVEINSCESRITKGKAYSKVVGTLTVFGQIDKLPFGYFNKRIQNADPSLTKSFFFFDVDVNPSNSPARIQNILERKVKFVYLYSSQYDPAQGQITSLNMGAL